MRCILKSKSNELSFLSTHKVTNKHLIKGFMTINLKVVSKESHFND